MNILYLCDEYPPGRHGGIGTAVQLLAREMVRKGHNVVVAGFCDWGYGGEDEFDDEGVKVFRFRRGLDSGWFRQRDSKPVRAGYKLLKMAGVFQYDIERSLKRYKAFLEELVKKYNIDIAEQPDFNEYVQYCKKPTYFPVLSIPHVVKIHGTISFIWRENDTQPTQAIYEMERNILLNASAVSSVSRYAADKTSLYFDYKKSIAVVYNGIEEVPKSNAQKQPLQVVYVGGLLEKKGVYQLAKAWNLIAEQEPGAKLYLLGSGSAEKVSAYLSDKAKQSVRFAGHVSKQELLKYLQASQAAVFPSYAETFGLAAVEAMACGTATLFTNRGAGPEIIRDSIDGLIIDPDDVQGLADKILLVLRDEQLRSTFEQNGRERVHRQFEIGTVADRNLELYEQILRQSAGR
jgi:glycosyltransferase involved in cell wall biosynthesis